MAAALELAKDPLGGHLALEVLDRPLDALVADLDFEGFTLDGIARIGQGMGDMAEVLRRCKTLAKSMPQDPRTRPTDVKAPHGARVLEIGWADGHRSRFPHEILRGYCPCASCQGHSGTIAFVPGGNLDIREIEQVGNYALSFSWGDAHSTGIYTFRFLRALGDLLDVQGADAVKAMGTLPRQ